jgi:hypothetical protein
LFRPLAFGYGDFALGAFAISTLIKEGVIVDDWADQRGQEQQRWAYLFSPALISKQEADAWAEKVWPSERSEEESLEEVKQKKQQSPPKPVKQPSPMQLEECERLVAEIKRHHPKAATEQIIRDLEAWGE